jgi:chromate transport protein ChrA
VFDGLRPAAAGLLAAVCCGLLRLSLWDAGHGSLRMREALLFAAFYVLTVRFKRLSAVLFIAAGALVGIALKL